MVGILVGGAPIGFFRGDPTLLILDCIALRPVVMPVVPRVMNRLHDKITQGMLAAGGSKAKLFVKACEAKVAGLHKGTLHSDALRLCASQAVACGICSVSL
jgi:long-chain acyl-CoA synthetase